MRATWCHGLYAVTDPGLIAAEELAARVHAAIAGGATMVQYRDKYAGNSHRQACARLLLTICREHQVPLIINDDITLVENVGADGVHLGRDDAALSAARRRLGSNAIIGVSCYNDLPRAISAAEGGADYVAFGRFFPSQTKPHAPEADMETLRRAKRCLGIPLVAIGGISADNGAALIAAGADLLAVIHEVFGQEDVAAAARSITALFDDAAGERQRNVLGIE